mmetsp:Transcript_2272/g.3237  ORF Transcript_2272/g.3237 Transcript_2272/m.3237 type:complete len:829 (-) Transcript_2272:44-2530(-)
MYEEIIYRLLDGDSDVLDGISNGNSIINAGSMGFSQTIQTELTPLLQNEDAFEVFTDCLTKPLTEAEAEAEAEGKAKAETNDGVVEVTGNDSDVEGNSNSGRDGTTKPKKSSVHIKRSFRAMTLIVNDTNSAQQLHKQLNAATNKKQVDEEKLYEKFLMNPTRAVILAKKIFASYGAVYQSFVDGEMEENSSETDQSSSFLCNGNSAFDCQRDVSGIQKSERRSTTLTKPHLPHLNKTLSALLAAYPKQVVLASCAGGSDSIQQNIEPMLLLQRYCPDYTSPMHSLIDLITMGCTGRKRETGNLHQQAMMNAGNENDIDQILITCAHRKKFVRSLTQWGLVQKFVDVITQNYSTESTTKKCGKHPNEHAAESACDALLSIMEFICFPQQIHPAMAMNGINNDTTAKSDAKNEESAGEEELFSPLASDKIIAQLTNCAHLIGDSQNVNANVRSISADAASRALVGSFEIATGKARKNVMTTPLETVEEEDGGFECKAQKKDPKDIPGIDDNKLLKAGVTPSMHSSLVSNMKLVVEAMDIYVKSPVVANNDADDTDASKNPSSSAVNHPGRYTVERPFTSRRLDIITLFADIVSFEDHNDDKVDRTAAKSVLEALMELPAPLPKDDVVDPGTLLNPWPGLCNLLFDYPENSLYGVQFFRMLHALCMTDHEKTMKLVIQKCKFLSRAIKECKDQSSCSNRGVLLRCLNALRLHSQSVAPHSFLRHYLDSHDGWKAFEDDLKKMTLEQQLPGGGIAVPKVVNNQISSTGVVPVTELDIDLGSPYAADLGFPASIKPYMDMKEEFEVVLTAATSTSPSKKKKKNRNNKKKKKK